MDRSSSSNQLDYTKTASFLILGRSGAGKTTLINSFVNHLNRRNYEDSRLVLIPQKQGHQCSFPEHTQKVNPRETDRNIKGESRTDNVTSYLIRGHDGERHMLIIDTPGVGDTRGLRKDKENIKAVIDGINQNSFIQAIIFVIEPNFRSDNFFKFYLDQLGKLLTRPCSKQSIVICTKNNDANFDDELKSVFSKSIGFWPEKDQWFTINNKCLWETPKNDSEREILKEAWDEGRATFDKIYEQALLYPRVLTKEIVDLYDSRVLLEKRILDLATEIEDLKALYRKKLEELEKRQDNLNEIECQIREGRSKNNKRESRTLNYNCKECNSTCIRDTNRIGYAIGVFATLSIYHWISEALDCDVCHDQNCHHSYENSLRWRGIDQEEIDKLEEKAKAIAQGGGKKEVTDAFVLLCKEVTDRKVVEIAELTVQIGNLAVLPVKYDAYLSYIDDTIYIIETNESLDNETKIQRKTELLKEKANYEKIKMHVNQAILDKDALLDEAIVSYVKEVDKTKYCLNNHCLELNNNKMNFICKICENGFDEISYACKECKYDVCTNCKITEMAGCF